MTSPAGNLFQDRSYAAPGTEIFNTQLFVDALVKDTASVFRSELFGACEISGHARVENSFISGIAKIKDDAEIYGCEVAECAKIYGQAKVRDINVSDKVHIFGRAKLFNRLQKSAIFLKGECKFGGTVNFDNLLTTEDFVDKYGADKAILTAGGIALTDVWDMGI